MSDILSVGASGISVYQRALTTVSNNIANVNTDGYSRQDVLLNANAPQLVGSNYLGTGAVFDGVRRQYDNFIEQNLRHSNSELQSQEPMVSYANRLIDLVGGEGIGLTSAMNKFFESARNLASDSASTVQRSTFLRDADGLATRFRELDGQFESIDTETRQAIQNDIGQINSYTTQLASLNKQLTRHARVVDQPAELLDQRDSLLLKLSALTTIKTQFSDNGSVLVSVGDVVDQGVLVRGNDSYEIGLSNAKGSDPSKLEFVLDPYGTPRSLPNLLSGTIGGVQAFREQVLNPTKDALDNLATTIASQVNAIHRNGIDGEGRLGGDLFTIESNTRGPAAGIKIAINDASRVAAAGQFRVTDDPLNTGSAQATIAWTEPKYGGPTGLYGTLAGGLVPSVPQESLKLTGDHPIASLGVVSAGMSDVVISLKNAAPGQALQVFTRDGLQLLGTPLGASPVETTQKRLILSGDSGMEPGISSSNYDASNLNKGVLGMDLFLGARGGPQMIQQFDPNTLQVLDSKMTNALLQGHVLSLPSVGEIKTGTFTLAGVSLGALTSQDAVDPARPSAQEVANWVNRSSAQTGISAGLSDTGRLVLVDDAQASAQTSQVSAIYGTFSAGDQVSMSVGYQTFTYTVKPGDSLDAVRTGLASLINDPKTGSALASAEVNPSDGSITLTALKRGTPGSFDVTVNATLANGSLSGGVVSTTAATNGTAAFGKGPQGTDSDLLRMASLSQPLDLNIAADTFTLNGKSLGGLSHASSMSDIVNWVNQNAQAKGINVKASIGMGGALRLISTDADVKQDIRLGIGSAGQPSDLTQLGFDLSVNIIGAAKDDLLVFATGPAGNVDAISQIGQSVSDAKQTIRSQLLQVKFTDANRYQIIDRSTTPGTVLADKAFDASAGVVSYRGLTITFASRPAKGDIFNIDGNQDGIGNNDNMLAMSELENQRLMPGELTMTEAYIEKVNQVGNMAQQASISRDALKVVHQQAQEARDGLAGVSLDEEAASLVRFQQAYQANARVMQAANDLFDAILNVK